MNRLGHPVKIHLGFIVALLLTLVIGYFDVIKWWYVRCSGIDSYYSHAFLIPFISGFMIWQKKDLIKEIPPELSTLGLFIICFACMLHILGTILYVFSVSGVSVFLLIIGIVLYLVGKKITLSIAFPLLFLVFMVPLPLAVLTAISIPMKIIVAKIGTEIIQLLGISVYREGFNITIPAGTLLVGNPCSGLRSLISFLALGAVISYYLQASMTMKGIFILLSIPIALLSNIIRVPMLILIAHFIGIEYAAPGTFWHDAAGILVFVFGFMMMAIMKKSMSKETSG